MLAYDDLFSIEYFYRKLRPYWRRGGWEAATCSSGGREGLRSLPKRCRGFDDELMADLTKAGGEKYAALAALAYRQSFAAHKLVADADGTPLLFRKENFSNGCISTVDVIYPMAPHVPSAESRRSSGPCSSRSSTTPRARSWKFPFAPHDLGHLSQGQRPGLRRRDKTEDNQMPVEESGNMLLLFAALAKMEGKPDFAVSYWPQLEQWAEYLKDKGLRSGKPALHRRLRRPSRPQRQPLGQGDLALRPFANLCERAGKKAKAADV